MNNIGQHEPPAEPDRDLVERAIVRVLEIAQHQGITSADFIHMLDSGIRITDLLDAMNVSTSAGYTIDCDSSWGNPALLDWNIFVDLTDVSASLGESRFAIEPLAGYRQAAKPAFSDD